MFAKVFEQIYDSSIAEDYQVRFVFEDLLTLADCNGVVDKTHEAIARRTNVPIEIIKRAINVLESPDIKSRRSDDDGRRIRRLDEHRDWGWFIVNYEYYRNIASEDQRREKTRVRVKKYREKVDKSDDVTQCNATVTLHNDSPSASASLNSSLNPSSDSEGFEEFWGLYPRKVGKGAALKAWSVKKCRSIAENINTAVEKQKGWQQWQKDSGQFIPHPATWLNQERWMDEETKIEEVDDRRSVSRFK